MYIWSLDRIWVELEAVREDANRDLWSPNKCSGAKELLAKQSQDYRMKIILEPFAKLLCFFSKQSQDYRMKVFFMAICQAYPFFKLNTNIRNRMLFSAISY